MVEHLFAHKRNACIIGLAPGVTSAKMAGNAARSCNRTDFTSENCYPSLREWLGHGRSLSFFSRCARRKTAAHRGCDRQALAIFRGSATTPVQCKQKKGYTTCRQQNSQRFFWSQAFCRAVWTTILNAGWPVPPQARLSRTRLATIQQQGPFWAAPRVSSATTQASVTNPDTGAVGQSAVPDTSYPSDIVGFEKRAGLGARFLLSMGQSLTLLKGAPLCSI